MIDKSVDMTGKLYIPESDVFMKDYPGGNRVDTPWPVVRVTAGTGGESFMILGSEKTAIYDCGLACFSDRLIHNIKTVLEKHGYKKLDYMFMSHTHYDHVGALPYIIKEWPEIKVCGSPIAARIFESEGAKKTMLTLGQKANELYNGGLDIIVDGLRLDIPMEDGDEVSLGKEKVIAYSTKGHTDCSMTYAVVPGNIIFASETTGGLIEPHTRISSVLKSFEQSLESAERMKKVPADYIIAPHYGLVPPSENSSYFQEGIDAIMAEKTLIEDCIARGLDQEQTFREHKNKFWKDGYEELQPFDAYAMNAQIAIKLVFKMQGKA